MIDWNDNAKAAVEAFAVHVGYERTAKLWLEGKSKPTQTKTVADAVEYFGGVWPESKYITAWWDSETNQILLGDNVTSDTICTREQFEAYVKEQEGEGWTHEYGYVPCRIEIEKPDEHGFIVIYVKGDGYLSCELEDIKPIKPRITKAQAWDMLVEFDDESVYYFHDKYEEIKQKYEVIDD